ncbi:AMP-binding protein [Owenweeksia hongkongensis]|uniref:AMP-binding protein n=1 Tax=Owenweeksia hongkongensis TaxID=253245 RepID=UPI003A92EDFF
MANNVHSSFTGLLHSFENYPDRIAVTDKKGVEYSYSEFYQHIAWCRERLIERGVKKGTRVLLAIPMTMELYAMMEALFSLGGVIIFLDPWLKGSQMSAIIKDVKPELLVCTPKIKWAACLMPAAWTIKKWFAVKELGTSKNKWTVTNICDDDTALITFTGGSSGAPKGADRSFGFLAAQLKVLKPHLQAEEGSYVDYSNFPIVGLADFAVGNHVVIPKIDLRKLEQANPSEVWETIVRHKVTRTITSPSLLLKIKEGMDAAGAKGELKEVITGGAPIPFSLIDGFINDFPNLKMEAIYGSTEAEPIAITDFESMRKTMETPLKGVFAGKNVPEVELKIIEPLSKALSTENLDSIVLSDGEAGEIIVTGEHVNKGYYKNEKAFLENKITDKTGKIWHRTGDVGYREAEGIYLVGRVHRIIRKEEMNYHPYPIELYLEKNLGIRDAAYIQESSGKVVLHLGKSETANDEGIIECINQAKYPLDAIRRHGIDLPRDARHRSKLDLNTLLKL